MRVTYTLMPRDEVLGCLGPHWPPVPGALVVRVRSLADVTHGALSIHEDDDRPGTTWWVVDGLIVPQDAGPPPLLPGDQPETVPEPAVDAPPLT